MQLDFKKSNCSAENLTQTNKLNKRDYPTWRVVVAMRFLSVWHPFSRRYVMVTLHRDSELWFLIRVDVRSLTSMGNVYVPSRGWKPAYSKPVDLPSWELSRGPITHPWNEPTQRVLVSELFKFRKEIRKESSDTRTLLVTAVNQERNGRKRRVLVRIFWGFLDKPTVISPHLSTWGEAVFIRTFYIPMLSLRKVKILRTC